MPLKRRPSRILSARLPLTEHPDEGVDPFFARPLPGAVPRPQRPRTFRSDDVERDLTRMKDDPLFARDRDPEFTGFVDRQFQRVFGDGPARQDATGRTLAGGPQRNDIEVFQPSLRPSDLSLTDSVGRNGRNRPDDVARAQRVLSNAGTFPFAMPLERTGRPSEPLFEGIETFQRENGLTVDGLMNPRGETLQALRRQNGEDGVAEPDAPDGSDDAPDGTDNPPPDDDNDIEGRAQELNDQIEKERDRIAEDQTRKESQEKILADLQVDLSKIERAIRIADTASDIKIPMSLLRRVGPIGRVVNAGKQAIEGAANALVGLSKEEAEEQKQELEGRIVDIQGVIDELDRGIAVSKDRVGKWERELFELSERGRGRRSQLPVGTRNLIRPGLGFNDPRHFKREEDYIVERSSPSRPSSTRRRR